uniref:Uncharacterized protein n=1 Tax=uncultured delta proteobacterium TaxID=34034 RepID=H5SLM5_9DELT|nr:hypothetical protein HGMM_F46H12C10 [uncultured delta proteobacterium]
MYWIDAHCSSQTHTESLDRFVSESRVRESEVFDRKLAIDENRFGVIITCWFCVCVDAGSPSIDLIPWYCR